MLESQLKLILAFSQIKQNTKLNHLNKPALVCFFLQKVNGCIRFVSYYFKLTDMKNLLLLIFLLTAYVASDAQTIELKEGRYFQNGKLFTGVYKDFDTAGKILSEMAILKGNLDGVTIFYFENGSKREERCYKKGLKSGTWFTWDEKGNKTAEACYKKDMKDGKWYIWDENGQKRYEMNYSMGEKTGTWYMWDEKGALTMQKTY
jgi:hypothetical protein